ncbi:MAG: Succinyl-CoA synthetase beta subunit, partial [uncultured bacterium]
MKLYEFEGHRILAKVGIESPFFVACSNLDEVKQARKRLKFPMVAKVQVLSGRRGKSGGVKFLSNEKQLLTFAKEMFGNKFNGEDVRFISFSKKIEIEKELYLSIAYDTIKKNPFFLFCEEGGVDIEEVKKRSPEKIVRVD